MMSQHDIGINATVAKAAHKENTIRLSYKSQVAMYISKGIHIETTAEFKCCKTVPFLGQDWPKLWDQVNALNDRFDWNHAC
jgi:hypothetical protein